MGTLRGSARTRALFVAAICAATTFAAGPAHGHLFPFDVPRALALAEPFGLPAGRAPAGPLWIKWRGFSAGLEQDADTLAYCRAQPLACPDAAAPVLALIEEARVLAGRSKLASVNRAVNLAIRYASDEVQYGVPDLWSSPLATFANGRGDCEDYAIAKYFILREAGVAARDLRLLLARSRMDGEAHAVLAARLDDRWLILDNRHMALVDDATAAGLIPLFALDLLGVWQFGNPGTAIATGRPDLTPAAESGPDIVGTVTPDGGTP